MSCDDFLKCTDGRLRLLDLDGQFVDVSDVTNEEEKGVLDSFLNTFKRQLADEFRAGRITGVQYSEAWSKGFADVLRASLDFTLAKERQVLEHEELCMNIKLKEADLELKKLEMELKKLEIELKKVELEIRRVELEIRRQELELAKIRVKIAWKELELKEWELRLKERELALLEENVQLTRAKVVTEKAQTNGSVIGKDSMLDVQRDLHKKQSKSFDADMLNKYTSLFVNTWLTRMNNDAATANKANMLMDMFIGKGIHTYSTFMGINYPEKTFNMTWTDKQGQTHTDNYFGFDPNHDVISDP